MKASTDGATVVAVVATRSERRGKTASKADSEKRAAGDTAKVAAAPPRAPVVTKQHQASAAPAPKPKTVNRTTVTKASTAVAEKPAPATKAAPEPVIRPAIKPVVAKPADATVAAIKVAERKPVAIQPVAIQQVQIKMGETKPVAMAEAQAATQAPPIAEPPPRPVQARAPEMRPGQPQMQNGRPVPPSRAAAKEEIFVEGDFVVYPTHGVGKVEKIAVEDIAGHRLELIHITFEENRMTLRVPVAKARTAGLRKLATRKMFDEALAVLKGRARIKRTMWSRRAQEYEAKINSGDPISIAEVVRDLHRNSGQPDQSFSERQIYEAAMDRLAAELGALDETDKMTATIKLINFLKTV